MRVRTVADLASHVRERGEELFSDYRQHSDDVLTTSYDRSPSSALDLIAYCRRLGVPFGVDVESVSGRRAETEQAVRLATRLGEELRRPST